MDGGSATGGGGDASSRGGAGGGSATGGTAGSGAAGGGAGMTGSCGSVAPCGGDLVGTWTIVSSCFSTFMPGGVCSAQTLSASAVTETGTYTFNSDMSYSAGVRPTGSFSNTLATSCFGGEDLATGCGSLNTDYQTVAQESSSPYSSATCAVSGPTCVCTLVFSGNTNAASGTYSLQTGGTAVTLFPNANAPTEIDGYCVQGSTLYLQANDVAGLGLGGPLVLTRQ